MLEAFKHAGEALPAGSPAAGGPFAGPRKPSEEEIAEAKVLMTVLAGREVFRSANF